MKIAVVAGTSSGMDRETIIQPWEHFKGFNEIWIIARRGERLNELNRQARVPLRKFALGPTREHDRDVLSQALVTVEPQVKFLVNVVGSGKIGRVEELGLESKMDMVALNCEALCAVTRMVLPYMKCNSRTIQYVPSATFLPQPGFAIYAATKSFVLSYNRVLSQELRSQRIYVTVACPRLVSTEFFDTAESTGMIPLYKRLVMANPKRVVQKTIWDNTMSRETSVYGITMKVSWLLCKVPPHRMLLAVMSFMNEQLPAREYHHMQTLIITRNEAGQRLDKFLTEYLNQAGKGFLYKMVRKKDITLNGKRCDGSEHLEEGNQIRPFPSDETIEEFFVPDIRRYAGRIRDSGSAGPSAKETEKVVREKDVESREHRSWDGKKCLDVAYEDQHALAVSKPSGMLSQKIEDSGMSPNECILNYLIDSGKLPISQLCTFKPPTCSRLDRSTSGLVVAGESLAGLQMVNEVSKDRSIRKYYQYLVTGEIKEKQLTAGFPEKDESTNTVSIYPSEVEYSIPIMTEYLPLSGNGTFTLLQVTLIIERSHQTRAHPASVGRPITGDCRYGSRSLDDAAKRKHAVRSQLLHSWRLVMSEALPVPLEYLRGEEFTAGPPIVFNTVMEGEGMGLPSGSQGSYPGSGQG